MVRHGLGLRWARVLLDPAGTGSAPLTGSAGIGVDDPAGPALVVPLTHGGGVLGRIECGPAPGRPVAGRGPRAARAPRRAGRRGRCSNLHLAAELADRLEVIRRQAAELAASRARLVAGQDAERQRIQRDLHDGVQQDLVVSIAKLAMARQRLRRGDPRAGESLDELQRDLGALLAGLREFAHAIHPPVLADHGLLERSEGQAGRLPVEVVIEAEASLRGRALSAGTSSRPPGTCSREALTNAVKHSGAGHVDGRAGAAERPAVVEVRDDGRGFDPARPAGLGLSGLADRMSIVDGSLRGASAARARGRRCAARSR